MTTRCATIKGLIEIAQHDKSFADAEYEAGSPKTYAHYAISLWGGIESALEQLMVNHLIVVPAAAAIVAGTPRGLSPAKFRIANDDEARDTVRRWQSALQDPSALGGTLELLRVFGVTVALSEADRRQLEELAQVRNVLLHRGGVVDGRATSKCPWMPWQSGETIQLSEMRTRGYFDAAGQFALALVMGVTESPHRTLMVAR